METGKKTLRIDKVESINHDSGSENVDDKTGTAEDRADMLRMGKVQELRVCQNSSNALKLLTCWNYKAKFPFHLYMGLFDGLGRILGMLSLVSKANPIVDGELASYVGNYY